VLHLATHGFYLDASSLGAGPGVRGLELFVSGAEAYASAQTLVNPLLLSGLALAGANRRESATGEEDGILTAEEIATLDLETVEWVVLSACKSGLGEISRGEGVFGLRRAFQIAGAKTQVLSLWPVADGATREWMARLYAARCHDGLDAARAVRQASLEVLAERRRTGRSTHPFYWGAFVAAGDWR
jgi:CHAT domain-containing protein